MQRFGFSSLVLAVSIAAGCGGPSSPKVIDPPKMVVLTEVEKVRAVLNGIVSTGSADFGSGTEEIMATVNGLKGVSGVDFEAFEKEFKQLMAERSPEGAKDKAKTLLDKLPAK